MAEKHFARHGPDDHTAAVGWQVFDVGSQRDFDHDGFRQSSAIAFSADARVASETRISPSWSYTVKNPLSSSITCPVSKHPSQEDPNVPLRRRYMIALLVIFANS
jgi:hypothetical protein